MKKKNIIFFVGYVIAALAIIVVVNIGIDNSRNSYTNNTLSQLEVNSEHYKEDAEVELNQRLSGMKTIANELSKTNSREDKLTYLTSRIETIRYSRLSLVVFGDLSDDPDSIDYYNGKSIIIEKADQEKSIEPFYVTERIYYKEALKGNSSITLINESSYDGSTVLIISSPIFEHNSEGILVPVGLVYGALGADELNDFTITGSESPYEFTSFLVASDGTFLTNFFDNFEEDRSKNLFSYIGDFSVHIEDTSFDIQSKSIVGTSGNIRYFDNINNSEVYIKYNLIDIDTSDDVYSSKALYVLTTTDSDNINYEFETINNSFLMVGILLSAIFLCIIATFYYRLLKMDSKLLDTTELNKTQNEELFIALRKAESTIFEYVLYDNVFRILNNNFGSEKLSTEIKNPTENPELTKFIPRNVLKSYLTQCFRLTKNQDTYQQTFKINNEKKETVFYLVSTTALFLKNDSIAKFIGSIKNVTASEIIRQNNVFEKKLRTTIFNEADYSFSANITTNKIFSPNKLARLHIKNLEITDFEDGKQKVITKNIFGEYVQSIKDFLSKENIMRNFIANNKSFSMEFTVNINGRIRWKKITVISTKEEKSSDIIVLIAIYDINEEKLKSLLLEEKAKHDHLTGLLNRYSGEAQFSNLIKKFPNSKFIIIDIDNFKIQNDTYGHQFGDKVLIDFSRKLSKIFNPIGSVARIGGDEFIALITVEMSVSEYKKVLTDINKKMTLEYNHEGIISRVTCSIGSTEVNESQNNFEKLYKEADLKLYQAKAKGKNTFVM